MQETSEAEVAKRMAVDNIEIDTTNPAAFCARYRCGMFLMLSPCLWTAAIEAEVFLPNR
jgi:hypothetical protein